MLIRDRKGEIYHVKSTTFDAGMLDLTYPAAVEFIKEVLIKRNMLDRGSGRIYGGFRGISPRRLRSARR